MIRLGTSEAELSDAIDASYNQTPEDIAEHARKLAEFDPSDWDEATGENVIYELPTLGRDYHGLNPKNGTGQTQKTELLILYVIGLDAGKLVFRERQFDFRKVPSEDEIDSKANEFISEGIGSFAKVDPLDLVWSKPCILGFIALDHRCKFLKDGKGNANAIHFPEGWDKRGGPKKLRNRNKSFGNSKARTIDGGIEILTVENHHLFASNGQPRPPGTGTSKDDYYKADIYILASFDEPAVRLPIIVDPGGRNTGP